MSRVLALLCVCVLSAAPAPARADRWFAGDLHMHVAPPDGTNDVSLDAGAIAERAQQAGMDFVVLTPHLGPSIWKDPARRGRFLAAHERLAEQAARETRVTLIPGVEYAIPGVGHFGVSGVLLRGLGDSTDFVPAARSAGAFIVVNHPFALPSKLPGLRVTHFDMSYRPWTHGSAGFRDFDGVEAWHVPLSIANVVVRPGGGSNEALAFAAADRQARATGRRIAVVGGTDNHRTLVIPTTWVRAADRSPDAILAGLRAGAVCLGGPEAGSLAIRGDLDPPDVWQGVGGRARASRELTITVDGEALLYVDGVERPSIRDRAVLPIDGQRHTVRVVMGSSRSGFAYVNF